MIRIRRPATLSIIATLFMVSVALGWGHDGHKTVAKIAEGELTPKARAEVQELLGPGVSLPEIAMWADDVKYQAPFEYTKPWHYMDAPAGATELTMDDCPKEGCVVSAINEQLKILADKKKSQEERAQALKFLVHFVGDVHQPLHCGHAADLGGNRVHVEFFGIPMNLHHLWDSGLIDHAGERWEALATDLASTLTPAKRALWTKDMNPLAWANESLTAALTHAYAYPTDGKLAESYFEDNIGVVRERLAMAGVRLGLLLNNALGEGNAVARTPAIPRHVPSKSPVARAAVAIPAGFGRSHDSSRPYRTPFVISASLSSPHGGATGHYQLLMGTWWIDVNNTSASPIMVDYEGKELFNVGAGCAGGRSVHADGKNSLLIRFDGNGQSCKATFDLRFLGP